MDSKSYDEEEVDDEKKFIPAELVKTMLGGRWPRHPFNFDSVSNFKVVDKVLVPWNGGLEAPGPNFRLIMVDDPIK